MAQPPRFRAGAAMQTASGCVSAYFELESFDRRRGVALYGLRVINRTKGALVCRTWVLADDGDAVLAHPAFLEVAPLSVGSTIVPLWPNDFDSFHRAIAEVTGDGVHCLVEAAAPPQPKPRRRPYIIAGASVLAGIAAIAMAGALRGAVPKIAAFSVAPQALAGTTVEAEYSTFGTGNLSYLVTAPDGHRVAGGPLAAHAGSVFVPIPAGTSSGAYSLRLAMEGPFGSASETRVVNAMIAKGGASASIADLSVKPMVAKPGDSLKVAYSAVGEGGYVRLEGTDGTIWAQQPFSRGGETQLVVPQVGDGRELHVVLHVTKGASAAQSAAGILVSSPHAVRAAADSGPAIAGDDDPNEAATVGADANGTFQVVTGAVHGGGAITVKILSPRNGMRIALNDPQSKEVTGTDAGSESDVVTLRAPTVTAATRYTVVATFTDGFGQESIVAPVTILP
ncbi:MAG: hypothetical protein WAJ94_15315 [Candidatus Cybelea sp.]